MALFILNATDHPNSLEKRLAIRPAHLEYMATFGEKIRLAGPVLNGPDTTPSGSMIIFEVDDITEVEDFAINDPYALAGLFCNVTISPYKVAIGSV